VTETRARLAELVARVERTGERVTVTRRGRPAAVLVASTELAALEETIEVLSDTGTLAALRQAQAGVAAGRHHTGGRPAPDPPDPGHGSARGVSA
jgi:prevent-host-death family protein